MQSIASDVVAANVDVYREMARSYDQSWEFGLGSQLDPRLERDLDFIVTALASSGRQIRCLDCGAGTGAVTLRMLSRGCSVTAVDVSPEMLNLLSKKLSQCGLSATLINASVRDFLCQSGSSYEFIGFHSVLHHIYDYSDVLNAAIDCLAPGGFLYTNVDPVIPSHPRIAEIFDSIDTAIAKLVCEPRDFIPGIVRRLKKLFGNVDPQYGRKIATAGDLAEFYARCGVDDNAIVTQLKAKGLVICDHTRFTLARTRATRSLNRFCKLKQEFKIIARKPVSKA